MIVSILASKHVFTFNTAKDVDLFLKDKQRLKFLKDWVAFSKESQLRLVYVLNCFDEKLPDPPKPDFTLADVLRKKGITDKVAVKCDPNLDFLE